MNWVKSVISGKQEYKKPKSILKTPIDPSDKPKYVTSSEYYKFWALFLAKEIIDYESLFLSMPSLPERIRFAVYLKTLERVEYVPNITQSDKDPALVDEIFNICLKNPSNNEELIFNIHKTLESEFVIDGKIMIPLIQHFLSMEGATEGGTYSILYQLLRKKGLFEAFTENVEPQISDIWNFILSNDFKIFIILTDFIICLKDATYEQMFYRAMEMSHLEKASEIINILACPSNANLYRIRYRKTPAVMKTRKFDESYYDFLIIQNKLIEAQERMKSDLTGKINQLEEENAKLSEENSMLKHKLKNIETQL